MQQTSMQHPCVHVQDDARTHILAHHTVQIKRHDATYSIQEAAYLTLSYNLEAQLAEEPLVCSSLELLLHQLLGLLHRKSPC